MKLRWNKAQTEIFNLIEGGASTKQMKEKGYKKSLIDKVKAAIARGDMPNKPPVGAKESPAGEPLLSMTLRAQKVILDPIIAVRYDSVRHHLGWGDEYTMEQFIDEATDLVVDLVGAPPPGFTRVEEPEETEEKRHKEVIAVGNKVTGGGD